MTDERKPPASMESERAILGTIIVSPECLPELSDLAVDDFFFPPHREVWTTIRSLEARGVALGALSLTDGIRARGIAGSLPEREGFVLACASEAVHPAQIGSHVARVKRTATMRRLIGLCVELQNRAYNATDADEVLSEAREGVAKLEANAGSGGPQRIGDILDGALAEIGKRASGEDSVRARFGIEEVDKIVRMRRGRLVVIAGLPGMGKTAAEGGILAHNAINGVPGIGFSLEMDRQEMVERFLSLRSHVPGSRIEAGDLNLDDDQAIKTAAKRMWEWPLWIDDRMLSANQIIGEANRWFAKHVRSKGLDFGLVAIDYLNLVRSDEASENRNREVAKLAQKFKALAKSLRITVLLLAQLNRKSADRGDEPKMQDLRDSGELEATADVIICPWREGHLKPSTVRPVPFQPDPARWLILKNKGGAPGAVDVDWHRERMEYADPALSRQQPPNYQDGRDQ